MCEADLTVEELFKTLKNFQKNKSPGLDGITAEFYLTFWNFEPEYCTLAYVGSRGNRTILRACKVKIIKRILGKEMEYGIFGNDGIDYLQTIDREIWKNYGNVICFFGFRDFT